MFLFEIFNESWIWFSFLIYLIFDLCILYGFLDSTCFLLIHIHFITHMLSILLHYFWVVWFVFLRDISITISVWAKSIWIISCMYLFVHIYINFLYARFDFLFWWLWFVISHYSFEHSTLRSIFLWFIYPYMLFHALLILGDIKSKIGICDLFKNLFVWA
jgi:hypothetical protein